IAVHPSTRGVPERRAHPANGAISRAAHATRIPRTVPFPASHPQTGTAADKWHSHTGATSQ
ncbi:hypothetical protein, partial [uncultured Gulosibacter sp.]|uniref:hypothetical protein n=1 Tax=uncultured Gulosibacter sp. TaxID=1339167 RepID=UPI00288A8085